MFFSFQIFPSNLIVWTVYSAVIGFVFTVIKVTNYRLHHMYDTSEIFEDEHASDESKSDRIEDASKTSETGTSKNQTQG